MTVDLYTTKDLKNVRDELKKEQGDCCKITGIPLTRAVLDHAHDDRQLCRGVIESTMNVFLGVIERGYLRYIKHWCSIPLPELLRRIALYLEKTKDEDRYRHTFWLKKMQSKFNSLSEPLKRRVLRSLDVGEGTNATQRKKAFEGVLKARTHTFEDIQKVLREVTKEVN